MSTGIVVFIVYKALGMLSDIGVVVFMFRWALPTLQSIPGAVEYTSGMLTDLILPMVEVVATAFGIRLVLRRAPRARLFWLVYLAVYAIVLIVKLVIGAEDRGAIPFLIGDLAWLAYWAFGRAPRQLALAPHWSSET